MKNIAGHKIILQMSTINDNHMMYGSRDMERERQNFLSFWTIFYLLTPPPPPAPHLPPTNNPKNPKLKKKRKNRLEILSFYTCVLKIVIT